MSDDKKPTPIPAEERNIEFVAQRPPDKLLEQHKGKTIKVLVDGQPKDVVIERIAHSFKYEDQALVNDSHFIKYEDLFLQLEGGEEATEQDWKELEERFNSLPKEVQRALLGYDTNGKGKGWKR
jgi:predicted nucleotide-binding protein (sugar kinase/HSP70/actin superfamily)